VHGHVEVLVEWGAFEALGVSEVAHEVVVLDEEFVSVVVEVDVPDVVVDDFLGFAQSMVDEAEFALVGRTLDLEFLFFVYFGLLDVD